MSMQVVYIGGMTTDANIILEAITGSRAYGLDHADSDTDSMGIFLAPTADVAGLRWSSKSETTTNCGPEGDDQTFHELGKFLRLTLKANPTLIELFFMDEYTTLTNTGELMLGLRPYILSETAVRNAYHGYAYAQMREYERRPNPKPKTARHCMRIARQGVDILSTGTANIRVPDPQEYWDLTELPMYQLLAKLASEVERLQYTTSVLPEKADYDRVANWLWAVRRLN